MLLNGSSGICQKCGHVLKIVFKMQCKGSYICCFICGSLNHFRNIECNCFRKTKNYKSWLTLLWRYSGKTKVHTHSQLNKTVLKSQMTLNVTRLPKTNFTKVVSFLNANPGGPYRSISHHVKYESQETLLDDILSQWFVYYVQLLFKATKSEWTTPGISNKPILNTNVRPCINCL